MEDRPLRKSVRTSFSRSERPLGMACYESMPNGVYLVYGIRQVNSSYFYRFICDSFDSIVAFDSFDR